MKHLVIIASIVMVFVSCSNYENQERYKIKVGENVEIYATTNSCCHYCFYNEDSLQHTKFLSIKSVDSGPEDCAGCDWTHAYIVEGRSVGIDTLKFKLLMGSGDCDSPTEKLITYIVEVK